MSRPITVPPTVIVEAREARHQILLVALRRLGAAEQKLRRRRNVLAVDDADHHHLRMTLEIVEHRDDQLRIAGMQHVVERYDAGWMQHVVRQLQIVAQRLVGVIAVDVNEARLLDRRIGAQPVLRQRRACCPSR